MNRDHYKTAKGWLTDDEASELRLLATGKVVLEIGSWLGRSTLAMAETATKVFSIDHHRGDDGTTGFFRDKLRQEPVADTLPEFRTNTSVFRNIVPLVGDTGDLAAVLADGFADVVFVDGAHDAESVERDVRLAKRCLKDGGVLAMHDWGAPGVKQGFATAGGYGPSDSTTVVDDLLVIHGSVTGSKGKTMGITKEQLTAELANLDQQEQQCRDGIAAAGRVHADNSSRLANVLGAKQMTVHLLKKVEDMMLTGVDMEITTQETTQEGGR